MALQKVSLILCLFSLSTLLFVSLSEASSSKPATKYSQPFNRSLFPNEFIFGAGTAAYQTEGAAFTDGKGLNIWDRFTRTNSAKIADRSNGDVANDFYHRYKEDVHLMKKVGLDSFRFSISWARILPKGKLSGGVNPLGVKFYNDLIDELLKHGIKPFVTLFHFDTPQALEDEYLSWLSPKIIKDYTDYADFCFKTFGDRVKHWVTFNEPNGFSVNGYNTGSFAPGRCSSYVGNCSAGNSATEPYLASHHILLSHASAVKLYREKYKPIQYGEIGITIVTNWYEPLTQSAADKKAAERGIDFFFGWYVEPVTFGHYPESMRLTVGDRLPKFTEYESKLLKGSLDFLGVNYYTTNYAKGALLTNSPNKSIVTDQSLSFSAFRNGKPIGTPTALSWLYVYPKGFWELLTYIKKKYNDPYIFVTENGLADKGSLTVEEGIKDSMRIRYHDGHLRFLLRSIKEGVKVKGYYIWTFWDDFEWDAGFTVRFGITFVDYKNNLKRTLKYSAYWFKMFLLN